MDSNATHRAVIAQGYVAMFLLLLMMFITDLVELGMKGNFSHLNIDPGLPGLWLLVVLSCLNILGQMTARCARGLASWALFGLTLAYTLFFVAHQVEHLLAGEGFDMHFLLDIAHHGAGTMATVSAWRVARQQPR